MLLNGGVLDGVRLLSGESVDVMWRNYLHAEQMPMEMNGWVSNEKTGSGIGWTISIDRPILSISDDEWQTKYIGNHRTGGIGWGGGAQTNWLVRRTMSFMLDRR